MKPLCAAVLGVMVFVLAGTTKAQDDTTKMIVGKWEVTSSTGETPTGAVVEFTKDGKLTATANLDGKEIKFDGTYKLDKDKLNVKLVYGEMNLDEVFTVKKLTDKELELEDKDKKVDTLKKK
jgi:uncharacterized protein (TIGR03066 family)